MVTHDDGESVDIDVIVNFNPTANIVSTNTVKGGDSKSDSKSDSDADSKSKSKAKATADEGDFSPGPNGNPGGGNESASEPKGIIGKLLTKKKATDKAKDTEAK